MLTLPMTLLTVLALAMLLPSTQARYLWNPNEQPQPVVHENSQPLQGEHHIISLTPEPPSSHSSTGESSTKKEPPPTSIQDHATSPSDPKPTSSDHKPPSSPKESKPAAAAAAPPTTHSSAPAKSDTPKGIAGEQHSGTSGSGKSGSATSSSTSPASDSPSASSETSTKPSSSSSSSSDADSSSSSSSSSGLVAGIVIGLIAIIGSIAAFVMVRRKKRTRRDMNPDPFTMGFGSHDPPLGYSNNKGTEMTQQTYYQPQQQQQQQQQQPMTHPAQIPPIHSAYATPPSPMTPMSSAPLYHQQQQQQPYYATTPVMDKAPTAATTMDPNGYQHQDHTAPVPSESLGVFNVVSTYSPTLSDELDIQLGDRIEIMVEYDDGWCQGINLTRGNTKGVFPRHCVEQYPGGEQQQQQQAMKMDGPPQLELGEMKRVSSMYMAYT